MMVPSQRLLILSAAILLPAASVAGLFPNLFAPCAAVIIAFALCAAFDAVQAVRRIDRLQVRTPRFLRFTKDVAATLPITVENSSRQTLNVRLAVTLPDGVSLDSATSNSQRLPFGPYLFPLPCTAHLRGDYLLPAVHLETVSPFGLWLARADRHPEFTFRVYPNLRDRATASLFLKIDAAGLRSRRQVGKGREFDNLRAYMPGDSFEDVHWKATARRGFPVVKLYRVEHAQE